MLSLFRIQLGVVPKSERGQISTESPKQAEVKTDEQRIQELKVRRAKNGGELSEAPEDSLIGKVANIFGRVFQKKRGKGTKRSLNVSVVIGKTDANDPRSYVFFFRSHLGSLGDLLSKYH